MHDRQEDVDQRATGKEGMDEPEAGAEEEAASADDAKDRVVGEGEDQAEDEVEGVPDRLGVNAVGRHGGAEQERDVHASHTQLAGRAQDGRQHHRAGKPPDDRSPDHRSLARV